MTTLFILSIIFYITASFYILLGVYVLYLNAKNIMNILFCLVCASLCAWAFSFSVGNYSNQYEVALFWRRFASTGWGIIFSYLLHFVLILTGQTRMLQKRWIYILIYLPAFISIYVFGISGKLAESIYQLKYTDSGWINTSSTPWDIFYNSYYGTFVLLSLYLIWRWRRTATDPEISRMSGILLGSFAFAAAGGTLTEFVINTYTSVTLPQMAPVVAVLPILCCFYSVKHYGLMLPKAAPPTEQGMILNKYSYNSVYRVMAMVLLLGALLNFGTQYYFNEGDIRQVFLFSSSIFLVGILIRLLQASKLKNTVKDIMFMLLLAIFIPVMNFQYIRSASVTIWAAPILFIMVSVVFNRRYLAVVIGVSAILTQVIVWCLRPSTEVTVNESDFIARIGFLGLALWFAHYINDIYINRLKENEDQYKFQKMVSGISAEFISVDEENLDKKVCMFLQMCGEHFKVDRTFFISMSKELRCCEWHQPDLEPAVDHFPDLTSGHYPWWVELIQKQEMVCYPNVNMLPERGRSELEKLNLDQTRSLMAIPMTRKGKDIGFLLFCSDRAYRTCSDDQKELLKIMANILSDAMLKTLSDREISNLAYKDPLTGLPNRTLFEYRLASILKNTGEEQKVGVFYIDLNAFKSVNDAIGHTGGDELLKEVARRMSGLLSSEDCIARFSGDEFIIVKPDIRTEEAGREAVRLLDILNQPFFVRNQEFFLTGSIGVALYPSDGNCPEQLIKNADLAMYESKKQGKNHYCLCSQEMKEEIIRKMKLTGNLYRAMERDELLLHYQPQVNVITGEITGFEALLRWNNTEFGMIPPSVFIPIAEQTGLINQIGEWVLHTACIQLKAWQAKGLQKSRIAVNLSAEQFRDRKLSSNIRRILDETGLDARYLELEITESIAGQEEENVLKMLHELKQLGVWISIDDFGMEYSSLNRLKILPIDQLKIDIQFVRNICKSDKDEAIAKTIIQLAKNLELNVIAEGVEHEEQYEFFRKEECDEIQGYYFYRPMPATEIEKLLLEWTDRVIDRK